LLTSSPRRLSDIKAGLASLREVIQERQIDSIAILPLGCGNGGLEWSDVRLLIVEALGELPAADAARSSGTSANWAEQFAEPLLLAELVELGGKDSGALVGRAGELGSLAWRSPRHGRGS
jgi:hypothetical protein